MVKAQFHQNQITSTVHYSTNPHRVTSVSDQQLFSFCANKHPDTQTDGRH